MPAALAALLLAAQGSVLIDPHVKHGIWEGWGASLCWMGNVFGERDDVADLFFTTKNVEIGGESLPGLGLNIVRYNAGACSTNEVDGRRMIVSKIILPYRQMEGFWLDGKDTDPNSTSWDWTRDARQVAMMVKAKARGANRFELFSNSPMWWMCANDNPSGAAKGLEDNLRPDMHRAFAIYLATIAQQAKSRWGISFTTVDPFNEPDTDYWYADCKQEGCHFSPATQAAFLPRLRTELNRKGLRRLPISASDETDFSHAISTWAFFDDATKALIQQVNVHGYQGEHGDRKGYREATCGKRLWNSEHGEGDPSGISLTRELNLDLYALHPTAWCYWQPLDGGGWGLLNADMPNAKILRANPKYFVLAQYTRHIRPGMAILETGQSDTVAAYDRKLRRLVIVTTGGKEAEEKTFDLSQFKGKARSASHWMTEPRGKLRYQRQPDLDMEEGTIRLSIPANSVHTIEIDGVVAR